MSLFQKRHFERIAEIAAQLELSDVQLQTLVLCLVGTNPNYKPMRFMEYVKKEMKNNE